MMRQRHLQQGQAKEDHEAEGRVYSIGAGA
jgi:hypothetical protein